MAVFTYSREFSQHSPSPPRTRERTQAKGVPHARCTHECCSSQRRRSPPNRTNRRRWPSCSWWHACSSRRCTLEAKRGCEGEGTRGKAVRRPGGTATRCSAGGEDRQSRPSPHGAGRVWGARTPPLPTSPPTLPSRKARTPFAPLGPFPRGCWAPPARDKGAQRPGAPAPSSPSRPRGGPGGEGAPFCGAARRRGAHPGRLRGRRKARGPARGGGHGAGEPGWAGRCRADTGVRALTVLLGAGGGTEQQQERSPAKRLHGWGRRRGAEGAGEKSSEARAEKTERCFRGGDPMAMSRPTGSAGGGGDCAAPSRLRLHLRRAGGGGDGGGGGGGGGSSSRASRALLNRRPPTPTSTSPHLGETRWGRASRRSPSRPKYSLFRRAGGGGEGGPGRGVVRCGRSR